MNLKIIDPTNYSGWNDLLLAAPGASFFHTAEWAKVLSDAYDYQPYYFAEIENSTLKTLLPLMEVKSFLTGKRGVSLPFTDFCPPVAGSSSEFMKALGEAVRLGKQRGWKTLELRGGQEFLSDAAISRQAPSLQPSAFRLQASQPPAVSPAPCTLHPAPSAANSISSAFSLQPSASISFITHELNMNTDSEAVFSGFRESTRRNIRKAEKEGVRANVDSSHDAVKAFYRLNCATRKKHGLPPQPFRFFEAVFRQILSKDRGMIVLAWYRESVIAAAVYFHFRDRVVFKYGASDGRYQHLRPNNLVMWAAVRCYAQKGFRSLHLGRSDRDHEGLLQFKRGWGAEEATLNYYKYDLAQQAFLPEKNLKTSYPALKITPLPLLKLAGRLLYRHVG